MGTSSTASLEEIVVYEAQPGPQTLLIGCPIEDVLFGGARGGGKTLGLLGDWISHADEYGEGARGILFRRTYDELEEVQFWCQKLFPSLGAFYRSGKRTWFFPNGAQLKLRYLERDIDAQRYQGHSYTWIAFDEAGNFPVPEPLDLLRACLRSGVANIFKCFRLTANPGGVGHNWIKARYIDPTSPLKPRYDEESQTMRVYIPSKLEDNPALMENDPDYWKRVTAAAGGNEALLKAWRDGDWDIVAGGMFDDLWDRTKQVLAPFAIPESWRVDRSFDWGSSKPFSVGWWAESDGTTAPNGINYPRGSMFRIAEWYGSNGKPNQGLKMLAKDIAKGVIERESGFGWDVKPGPADTAIWNAENGVCIADDMAKEGVKWTKADKSPGSRKTGWERLRAVLNASKNATEDARLYVFSNCTHFIRTVPVIPRSTRDLDDVDTNAEDHIADETRYRIMALPAPAPAQPRKGYGF